MYGLTIVSTNNDRKVWCHHRYRNYTILHVFQNVPRPVRLFLVTVIILCALAGFVQGRSNFLDQVKKSYPTDFSRLHAINNSLWSPFHPVRHSNGTHIDDIYTYIGPLGKGQEGSIALYKDDKGVSVAVKTFSLAARNEIPLDLVGDFVEFTTTWPSEIEASLLLSSLGNSSFVPVLDYFILAEADGWSWALVSPLMLGGTLLGRAQQEHAAISPGISDELDSKYRRSLKCLLLALEDLHLSGLCHDDIKPDNVFIGNDPFHWMLGDLGNVREVKHPWHTTASWTRQNQLADCKTNDVKRALKTYLSFIRAATVDKDEFDQQFWMRESAWSRMYWEYSRYPIDAGRLAKLSDMLYPQISSSLPHTSASNIRHDVCLAGVTERELTCTSVPMRWWSAKHP